MAPGRPVLSLGIQPQIALYSVILGSVCAFGWYSEKYRRNEGDLDGHIQKAYLRNVQEAKSNMPQMAAAIRGHSMELDGRMDKMVWGGKAQLPKNSGGGGSSSSSSGNGGNNNGTESSLLRTDDGNEIAASGSSGEEEKPIRKRRKRKRKKPKTNNDKTTIEKSEDEQKQQEQKKKLVLQSSIAGVAVGAVVVGAISVLMGSGSGGGRK